MAPHHGISLIGNRGIMKSTQLTPIDRYLLDIGTEDYSWVADATTSHLQKNPFLSRDQAIELAQKTIRRLFDADAISLYWDDQESSSEDHRAARPLTASEVQAVFRELDPWIPGLRSPNAGVAFATTDAGERLLHSVEE